MNYNYILHTGDSTISGSTFNIFESNQIAFLQDKYLSTNYCIIGADGEIKEDPFYYDDSIITGSNCSRTSLNSQTMLEGNLSSTAGKNRFYYSFSDQGSYAIDQDHSANKFIFDTGLTLSTSDLILYDKRNQSDTISVYKTASDMDEWSAAFTALKDEAASISVTSSIAQMESEYDIFFNGQKVYLSDTLDYETGILFGIQKPNNIQEITGTIPDVYGTGFVENHVNLYLNGLEQETSNFLEIFTGVTLIETGVNTSIKLIQPTTENFSL
jgi:hypothetical protein